MVLIPPDWLVDCDRALNEKRVDDAEAILAAAPTDGDWSIARAALSAFVMLAKGLPFDACTPALNSAGEEFNRLLGTAKLLVDDGEPLALASALAICDILIANAAPLGSNFSLGLALARNLRATALTYEGRAEEALVEIDEATALAKDEHGDDTWVVILVNAAAIASELDRFDAADRYLALGVARVNEIQEPHLVYTLLRSAADVCHARGRYLEAKQKIETAIAVLEKAVDDPHADRARALATLANFELELGDAGSAVGAAEAATAAWPKEQSAPYWLLAPLAYARWARSGEWRPFRALAKPLADAARAQGSTARNDFLFNLALVCNDRSRFRAAERLFAVVVDRIDATSKERPRQTPVQKSTRVATTPWP